MNALLGRTGIARLAVAMAVTAMAGCGEEASERDQVRGYLVAANEISADWAKRFQTANDSYISFSRGELEPAEATTRLAAAARQVRAVRDRIARLGPPPRARALHAKLVEVYDLNVDFADQTALLAAYQQQAQAILEPVTRYDRALNRGLSRRRSPHGQARALAVFARRLKRTLSRLRALEAPRVLRVSHGDQIRRLDGARDLALDLRSALRAQNARRIARLLVRFREGSGERRPRRRLAREAVRDYGRRYEALARAYQDIRAEQDRLDRALG